MLKEKNNQKIKSSFRDPSGFVFQRDGRLYRQVNQVYQKNYQKLIHSGLYQELVQSGCLIPHQEVKVSPVQPRSAYKIIQPRRVSFVSYPYEWCFSQLKDAALLTLKIQKKALKFGLSLKDASAFNIQFDRGKPILIDSLSFEKYKEGKPWVAYRQFCQHFLAPLALMSYKDVRLAQLFRIYLDGIPLDLTSLLLPAKTWFKLAFLIHIHLHSKSQKYYSHQTLRNLKKRRVTKIGLLGLLDHLENLIQSLSWQPIGTEWANYYQFFNYPQLALKSKKKIIKNFLSKLKVKTVWDLGANDGLFSRLASNQKIFTLSIDSDPAAVEKNYLLLKKNNEKYLLPLVVDITNPSPNIGWDNQERKSLLERGRPDVIFAFALVHHLAISNNLPLIKIAEFMAHLTKKFLLIEFIPKEDSQIKRMLKFRQDIFTEYNQNTFDKEFGKFFIVIERKKIEQSRRILYLMRKK